MIQIKRKAKYKLWESFIFAFRGIGRAIKKERNVKIHLVAASLATLAGLLLKISVVEWIVLLLLIASIISAEIMNAAVEAVCDLLRFKLDLAYLETYWIRNFAAGAVMVLALAAVIIGVIIFGPKLLAIL
jgi:diacylglycerol kinase (ATP)